MEKPKSLPEGIKALQLYVTAAVSLAAQLKRVKELDARDRENLERMQSEGEGLEGWLYDWSPLTDLANKNTPPPPAGGR